MLYSDYHKKLDVGRGECSVKLLSPLLLKFESEGVLEIFPKLISNQGVCRPALASLCLLVMQYCLSFGLLTIKLFLLSPGF